MRRMTMALAAMLAAAAPAAAEVVEFDGMEVVVGTPGAYCAIGDGQFSAVSMLLLSDDPGEVLIAFARCEELAELEAGSTATVRHYGLIAGVRDAEGGAVRPGKPLDAYLQEYDVQQSAALDAGTRRTLVGFNGNLSVEIEPLGLVSASEQAHFAGLVLRPDEPGREAIIGVTGRTLVSGRAVQVEVYGPDEGVAMPELILLARDLMSLLWEHNPDGAGVGETDL